MSPDWSAKAEPVPYSKLDNPQSLNLYAYVLNNPLSKADRDGHEINAQNPCNGQKNCTSSVNVVSLGSKTNNDGSITVTQVADVKSTTNNKDGTSTIHGATVTTSTTFDSKDKP